MESKKTIKISPARLAAFEILSKIEKENAYSSALLPVYEDDLPAIDRSLCHQLTLGVLRKQIYLDRVILLLTNGKKIDLEIRIILRLGLYQLLFLDKIPAYSAINDSVNLVQKIKKTSAKGFVNAILRRATREAILFEFTDEIEEISIETSHPRWLLEKWVRQFGLEETKALASVNNETPKLSFRFTAKTSDSIRASLKEESAQADNNYLRELAENGKIYFQDEGSQMIASVVDLKPGEKFLDICAAPGSKLTQIATNANQFVFGGDLHLHRLRLMNRSAERQGLKNISVVQYNAEKPLPFVDESFDVILVDAPCSGTGTIRHNPELRYTLQNSDFAELSAKQLNILKNASKSLKRSGRLFYSTCSLETEENEDVIARFIAENQNFAVAPLSFSNFETTGRGFIRTFPPQNQMDGFFVAMLSKIA